MSMSEAAMDGIRLNGHGWQFTLKGLIKPETMTLAKLNDLIWYSHGNPDDMDQLVVPRSESEPVVERIITKMKDWITDNFDDPEASEMCHHITSRLVELEAISDCCMGEINFAMDNLYDTFDFWRVLV